MSSMPRALVVITLTSVVACASTEDASAPRTAGAPHPPASSTKVAPFAGVWRHPSDPRVGGFVSSPWSFSTTSYWIEGDDDLILVDTQFLPTEAIAFVDEAERVTGKRARLAVVLHANPDKFNGTAALQARGITVVTSDAVRALIPSVHEKRVRAFGARYAPDYPTDEPRPWGFTGDVTRLSVPGATVELIVTGPGCSEAHTLAVFDDDHGRHVFAGDLLANGAHAWLEIGRADAWLVRLDEIAMLDPTFVYPGRGLPTGPELVEENRAYLRYVVDAVAVTEPVLPVEEARWTKAKDVIVARYPERRFPVFLDIGLPAVSAHLASSPPAPTTE